MARGHSTSVHGANYVLHLPAGNVTLCGRQRWRVNCAAGVVEDDELCRACARKRDERIRMAMGCAASLRELAVLVDGDASTRLADMADEIEAMTH